MRFFFDENLSPKVIEPIRPLFGDQHQLESIYQFDGGRLSSADDGPLLTEISRNFDVLVTQDRAQLVEHRARLLDTGLHWIGLRQPHVSDLHGLAATTACLLAGLPHAIDAIESWQGDNGCWVTLKGMQREAKQRITVRNQPLATGMRRLRSRSS